MKKAIFKIVFASALIFSAGAFYSCSSEGSDTKTEHSHDSAESKYICPMECEGSAQDEPGTCPVCEMDLVLRSEL